MRLRFLIYTSILALAVFVIIYWLRPVKQASTPEPTQTAVQSISNVPAISPTVKNVAKVSSQPVDAAPLQANPDSAMSYSNKMHELFERYKEGRPVEFYGQVIDQNSNPISNVKIDFSIQQTYMVSPTEFAISNNIVRFEKETGTDGRIEVTGEKGDNVDIDSIQKEGYDAEPGQRTFGAVSGSFDNPVSFKMWSTNIHEQLITGNKGFEVVPDGRPYFINLTEGAISETNDGDLKIWIQYTNQPVRGQLYDWSAGIEVINGGLLEVPQVAINSGFLDESPFAMYSAPKDGYIPSFSLKNQIRGGQSGEIGNRYFYLLLNNGKEYGRMSINLFAPYGRLHPGLIRISYAVNPSGSHILR
jgi:hypothetical protein